MFPAGEPPVGLLRAIGHSLPVYARRPVRATGPSRGQVPSWRGLPALPDTRRGCLRGPDGKSLRQFRRGLAGIPSSPRTARPSAASDGRALAVEGFQRAGGPSVPGAEVVGPYRQGARRETVDHGQAHGARSAERARGCEACDERQPADCVVKIYVVIDSCMSMEKYVREVMSHPIVSATADVTLGQLAELLAGHRGGSGTRGCLGQVGRLGRRRDVHARRHRQLPLGRVSASSEGLRGPRRRPGRSWRPALIEMAPVSRPAWPGLRRAPRAAPNATAAAVGRERAAVARARSGAAAPRSPRPSPLRPPLARDGRRARTRR